MDADPYPLSPAPAPSVDASPLPAVPSLPPRIRPQSAFVAATLGWVLPGLGQVYVGRPRKGLLMLGTIGGLFALGLWLTGFTCVDPESYGLEFVAHMWIGGPTAAAYWFSRDIILTEPLPYLEVGRLYAAVAGLLNLVAICDALGGVIDRNEAAATREALRETMIWDHEDAVHEAAQAATLAAASVEGPIRMGPDEEPLRDPLADDHLADDHLTEDALADEPSSEDRVAEDEPSNEERS